MLLKILRYILGYIKVEVKGFAPERFMNLVINNDVVIWDVETTERGYIFYTGRKNLLKMKPLLQKTNVKLSILEKNGLFYFIRKNKKRVLFIIGIFLAFMCIYVFSLFIWEIRVEGENDLVSSNIIKVVEEKYIPLGTKIKDINCTLLEQKLREEYDEISWISCDIKGTTLTIVLEEGITKKNKTLPFDCGDIIASKDATITKIITRDGVPLVKVNEAVKKGDVLISGTIYMYDDTNEVMDTEYILADGDVYGKTTESYMDQLDMSFYQKIYNSKSKKYFSIFFLDYCFAPYLPKTKDKIDSFIQIKKLKLFSGFYLPIGIKVNEYKKYELVKKQYTEEQAREIITKRLNDKISTLEQKGVEIIQNNVKIECVENCMVAKGDLIVNEPIAIIRERK